MKNYWKIEECLIVFISSFICYTIKFELLTYLTGLIIGMYLYKKELDYWKK